MILYFAGSECGTMIDQIKAGGATNVLMSAFYLQYKKDPNVRLDGMNLIMDSGGFTARKQGKQTNINDYIDFINKFEIKVCFNLDTTDVAETLENQKLLVRHTDARIIPVYHYSDYVSKQHIGLLEAFAGAGFDYISLGGTAEGKLSSQMKSRFFDYVFKTVRDTVKIHGLAVTSPVLLNRYPFFSVDSTTWLNGGKYGALFKWDVNRFDVTQVASREVAKFANFKLIEDYKERLRWTVGEFLKMEHYYTELWAKRGVTWDALDV